MNATSSTAAARPIIEADGLTKRYGSSAAVDSLSFDVPAGEVIGLLGPNGAGKTTAMKMLLGLVRPSAGRVRLLGTEHGSPEFADAIRRVGALIESPALYERLSARDNLELQARALGLPRVPSRIDELLELVDLSERAADRAGTYSLGMKQRLGIAVAMIGRPELVILDEPANGLDPAGIVDIRRLLRRLPDMGTTVLVSSHQLSEVQQACDRLLILNRGQLIASGTTAEILAGDDELTIRLDPTDVVAAVETCHRHQLTITSRAHDAVTIRLAENQSGQDINQMLAACSIYAIEIVRQTIKLEEAFLNMTGADQ